MHIEPNSLRESNQRGIRLVARELLSNVREKAESLGVEDEPDALHDFRVSLRRLRSWIRAFEIELSATVRPKVLRRLKRMADATRTSRDSEVHIGWLEKFARARRGKHRAATEWLLDHLRARKASADVELRKVVDRELERTSAQLGQGLAHYVVDLDEPAEPLSAALSELLREHAETAASSVAKVQSVGDRAEAHQARIATKRLRYLLEPLTEVLPDAPSLVDDLAKLQDALGALHDAQIFGSEIAKHLAKVLAAVDPSDRDNSDQGADDEDLSAANDRASGLRAISQRLHREELQAFDTVREGWLEGGGTDSLWLRAEAIAESLEAWPGRPTGSARPGDP